MLHLFKRMLYGNENKLINLIILFLNKFIYFIYIFLTLLGLR